MIEHGPSQVLSVYLIATGVVNLPSNPVWPCFYGQMPALPNQVVSIHDTDGILDGREMRGGKTVMHPGWQIRIRSQTENAAQIKGQQICIELDEILRTTVVIGAKTYKIQATRRMSPIIPIGQEEGGARLLFTINGTITYGEV